MTGRPSGGGAGPIALVGSGEFLPAMEAVDAALLAGRPARAVFLPTAAGAEGRARVGCSAGACARTAVADDIRTGAARPGLAVVPGLVVLPHFDRIERWRPGIVDDRAARLAAGQTLLGIDEETALVSADDGWRVEGRR